MSGRRSDRSKRMTETIWRRRAAALLLSISMILTANASSFSSLFSYVRAEEEDPTSAAVEGAATVESELETTPQVPLEETEAPSEVFHEEESEVTGYLEETEEPSLPEEVEVSEESKEDEPSEETEDVITELPEETEVAPTEMEQEDTASETVVAPKEMITYQKRSASGVEVTATFEEGTFAEEVSMYVYDIDTQEAVNLAAEMLSEENAVYDAIAVDIVFMTADGRELEPLDGHEVHVSISIPKQKKLEGDDFALVHVKEDGSECIEDAVLSENQAIFTTESFSIYVLTAVGEVLSSEVHDWLDFNGMLDWLHHDANGFIPNTDLDPYLLREGETLVLHGYSASNTAEFYLDTNYNSYGHVSFVASDPVYDTSKSLWYTEATFTAESNGVALIKFGTHTYSDDTLYVAVCTPTENKVFNLTDSSLSQYSDASNPYVLFDGEQIGAAPIAQLSFIGTNGVMEYTSTGSSANYYKAHRVENKNNWTSLAGGLRGTISGSTRQIYFKAVTSAMALDHADIEIADGGTFTSSAIYVENGNLYKRVDTCKTYVEDVNECILYQEDNTPCQFYHGNGTPYPSSVTGYLSKDYGKDPTKKPTDRQYELTSKYKFVENPVGSGKYETGDWSDIFYQYDDVDHATFDLKLYVDPTRSDLYQYDPTTGDWIYLRQVTVPDEDELDRNVDSILFELDHTAVVDAYNKCPMHNGLDFTVKTNHSKVQVQATKELLNGSLSGNDFEFEIVEFAGTSDEKVITSTKNDANGNISFDIMSFDKPGTHYFTIREKKDSTRTNIHFDTREYQLIVDIISNDGLLEASIILPNQDLSDVDFKFSNSVLMKLPNTGGIGTIPFYVGGGLLLTIAILLLIKKKVLDREKDQSKGGTKNE